MKNTKPFYRVLSAKIRLVREVKEITQEQMAKKLNMTKGNYCNIEGGKNQIYVHDLIVIAEMLEIKVERLFENNV